MRASELLERAATDDELRQMGWNGDPNTRWIYDEPIKGSAPTAFTAYSAVASVLGKSNVTDDEDQVMSHQYLVYPSSRTMFVAHDDHGAIELVDPDSRDARSVAMAVHEACHAWLHARGEQYTDEKTVNDFATTWLKNHLSGPALHVALETILKSKISYGHN